MGIAFTCFVEMSLPDRKDIFEDWIRSKSGRKENELAQLSHAFRGSCLRSLPEFLEETRTYGAKQLVGPDQINAGIAPTTVNVVNFAKQLCEFPETVEGFLETLGDGNWLPGGSAGQNKVAGLTAKDGELLLIPKYLGEYSFN